MQVTSPPPDRTRARGVPGPHDGRRRRHPDRGDPVTLQQATSVRRTRRSHWRSSRVWSGSGTPRSGWPGSSPTTAAGARGSPGPQGQRPRAAVRVTGPRQGCRCRPAGRHTWKPASGAAARGRHRGEARGDGDREDGRQTSTATATFVQVASASPMTTLAMRIEPASSGFGRRQRHAAGRPGQPARTGRGTGQPGRQRSGARRPLHLLTPGGRGRARSGAVDRLAAGRLATPARSGADTTIQRQRRRRHTIVEATGSWVQASSRSAMETLVRLDPSIVRLGNRRRGGSPRWSTTAAGLSPCGSPCTVTIRRTPWGSLHTRGAGRGGGSAGARGVTVKAPGVARRRELSRPFTVAASDGASEVVGEGSLVQSAAERRPLARVLFTLLGALAIFIGTMLPWLSISDRNGFQLDAGTLAGVIGRDLDLLGFERLISVGLVIAGLAVLMLFGLAGRSGRLTRFSAVLAALRADRAVRRPGPRRPRHRAGLRCAPGAHRLRSGLHRRRPRQALTSRVLSSSIHRVLSLSERPNLLPVRRSPERRPAELAPRDDLSAKHSRLRRAPIDERPRGSRSPAR